MKKQYEKPLIEVIVLEKQNFIVMSSEDDTVDVDFGELGLTNTKVVD